MHDDLSSSFFSASFAKAKDVGADRNIAAIVDLTDCTMTLDNLIAAAEGIPVQEFPTAIKDVKITNVHQISSAPCSGGADGCRMVTARGDVGDAGMSGHFLVTAGRGNCFVESISIHPVSPKHAGK